jgi:hypothetical protein
MHTTLAWTKLREYLKKMKGRTVMISESLIDRENSDSRGPCYCMVELINTSANIVEMGRNEKIGGGEPLKLGEAKVFTEKNRANYEQYVNKLRENNAVEANRIYHISKMDNEASISPI